MEKLEKIGFDSGVEGIEELTLGVFQVFVALEVDPLVRRDVLSRHPKLSTGSWRKDREGKGGVGDEVEMNHTRKIAFTSHTS